MKKKIRRNLPLIFFILVMVVSLVLPFKYYLVKKYNYILDEAYIKVFDEAKTLKIEKNEKIDNELFLDNVTFKIDYKYTFKRANTKKTIHNYYSKYYEDEVYDANLIIEKNTNLIPSIEQEDLSSKIVLKNKNITNNKELYDAFKKDYKTKTTIFTKKNDILYLYVVRAILKQTIKSNSQLYHITGDYDGYLMVEDSKLSLHIFNGDDDFVFTFINKDKELFDLEYVKEFIKDIDFIR